ncbi:LOW QUALITY PROTEIN: n amino acid transport system protein [Fusarium acuminatum]|uniref:N amino acid transport system protein n=1 Tax=Fusarium acuminatum TaxID=5515 RepID=A0ABZ2WZQ6_9HYPO
MRSHTIRSAAKGGNGLASAPLQLSKYDDEDSPSRDAVFGEISDEGPDYRSVGLIGTAGLMMKTQIGLGVLSIPATFNALGMIPGIICLLTVAIVTTWSNWIVGIFKLRHRHVYAIDDAGGMMFGAVGREFFGFAMWIYWVFVSGAGMLGLSIGLNAVSNHGACTAVFVAVAAVLGFVLSSIRTLGRMSWLAWVGVISIMISVIMVTIATGVQERPAAAPKEGVWVSDYKLFNTPSFVQAASSICSLISAYGGTPGFFAIVAEMRRPEQYTRALIICQSIVTVTYLIIGCLMYYFCGSYVSSPALGSAGDTIKKASYGVAIPGLIVSITLVTHTRDLQWVPNHRPAAIANISARSSFVGETSELSTHQATSVTHSLPVWKSAYDTHESTTNLRCNSPYPTTDTLCSQRAANMFKQRSHDTHYNTHLPLITGNPGQYTTALLGSNLMERFKTTGAHLSINQNPHILNLGVSGDKIQNVQYRINQGLVDALKEHQKIKLIYVQIGGNNLNKNGLHKEDVDSYGELINGLRAELPDATIVITALFLQRGLEVKVIKQANKGLIADENGCEFLPFDDQRGMMGRDKVHPNIAGYTKWNDILKNGMKFR